jgi:hypothetical protein
MQRVREKVTHDGNKDSNVALRKITFSGLKETDPYKMLTTHLPRRHESSNFCNEICDSCYLQLCSVKQSRPLLFFPFFIVAAFLFS